jgi:hypothetical protein
MQKWEFLIVLTRGTQVFNVQGVPLPHPLPNCWDFLNQCGDEGWEVVSSNLIGAKLTGVNPADGVLYLKRSK